ncbi:MAG: M28 family peptidase, partial [Candidatus Bathyarchaeia archaeon]
MRKDSLKVLFTVCLMLLLFSVAFSFSTHTVKGADTSTEGPLSYEDIIRGNYFNIDRIREDVRFLTVNATPRVTGYPGFYKAQEYVFQEFLEANLTNVQYQWYNITVPVDLGGSLEVYSSDGTLLETYPVSHFWPNSVQVSSTPPGGIRAGLFYAGRGDYADYDGRMVNESIVILDFNSEYNWLKAMELGAKAIVFIEPDKTSNLQSLTKYLYSTPIYAPRVYLKREDAGRLLSLLNQHGGTLQAKLESRMEWQVKRVANIIGFSPGTTLKDQWIIFFAHFDAWSVVPSLTEGATDACGIAGLLELIRFYTTVPHARSMMFIALSGHGEGLYGARYFVDSLLVDDAFPQVLNPSQTTGQGIFFIAGLDLSPESESVGPVANSDFYFLLPGLEDFVRPVFYSEFYGTSFVKKMSDAWQTVYGRSWRIPPSDLLQSWSWWSFSPTAYIVDADAFYGSNVGAGTGRITYRTLYAWFDRKYTPLDTLSRLEDLNNLKPQMEFVLCTSYDLSYITKNVKPQFVKNYNALHWQGWSSPNFYRLTAQVVVYNESHARYDPLPNAIVQVQVSATERVFACLATWFETADEKGYFRTYVLPSEIGKGSAVGRGF